VLGGVGTGKLAAAEECRGSGLRCRRDEQCCSGKCRNRLCKAADLEIGDACDPDQPGDCVTGVCGCIFEDDTRCTCRRATCFVGEGLSDCDDTGDCCEGVCHRTATIPGLCVTFKRGRPV
jgi:hypothetical protein